MARTKKDQITPENVQAADEEVSRVFPKLAAKSKIKAIIKEKDLLKIRFKDLTFSPGQFEQLSKWQDDDDELLVTLEQFQGKL